MKNKLRKIIKKPFIKSVIVMSTGTIAAQVVKMFLSPIVTRLYGPGALGIMRVLISIIQIIGPMAALPYPIAIVLPKNHLNAKGLIRLSLYISPGTAIIIFLSLLLF